jgi:Domain of unknown function (DUF4260)
VTVTSAVATRPNRGLATTLLRLEGAAALVAGILLYQQTGADWIVFIVLLLLPDLSILGYARGPAVGAVVYDLVHNWALAGALLGLGFFLNVPIVFGAGAALLAHIGGDRLLGYGLKYPTSFQDTHLGRIGRR